MQRMAYSFHLRQGSDALEFRDDSGGGERGPTHNSADQGAGGRDLAEPDSLFDASRCLDYDCARNARLGGDCSQVINQKVSPQAVHAIAHPTRPGREIAPQVLVRVNAYAAHRESLRLRKHLQIRGGSRLLGCAVHTILHLRGMEEVLAKMRNVLQELCFQPQPDMVEEHQVLMQLPHVANVRHHGKIEDPGEKTYREEFADPRDPGAIDLDKRQRLGLHEVLEQDTV